MGADSNYYTELQFQSDLPFSIYECSDRNSLMPLSPVNIFIGSNNSGKSRMLRSLFAYSITEFATKEYSGATFRIILTSLYDYIAANFRNENIVDGNARLIGNVDVQKIYKTAQSCSDLINHRDEIFAYMLELSDELSSLNHSSPIDYNGQMYQHTTKLVNLIEYSKSFKSEVERLKNVTLLNNEYKIYVPMLRGMRPLNDDQTDFYRHKTVADYFQEPGLPKNCDVFSGTDLYSEIRSRLLGSKVERKSVRDFEDFLSKEFFQGRSVTLTPNEKDKVVHVQIGNEEFPIHNLGDGLQNLIICVFHIFTQKERCLFFLEEPDLCMHPGMQRAFLKVLTDHNQHQYFLTSHSNHLLDMAFDFSNISVFHFTKVGEENPRFKIRATTSGDRDLLVDLGVRNLSVFLTNATIWVEGITDRLYLREYMRKYLSHLAERGDEGKRKAQDFSKLKEDFHYSFVEYQGANLTHWSFDEEETEKIKASTLCAHAFVIADGDVTSKGTRQVDYSKMLNDRFYCLPVKEIENLLPEEILRQIVSNDFTKRGKSVSAISSESYAKPATVPDEYIGLGKYLDSLLGLAEGESEFATSSGTVKQKGEFCRKAIDAMQNPEVAWHLTRELSSLCERIFKHIWTENFR